MKSLCILFCLATLGCGVVRRCPAGYVIVDQRCMAVDAGADAAGDR